MGAESLDLAVAAGIVLHAMSVEEHRSCTTDHKKGLGIAKQAMSELLGREMEQDTAQYKKHKEPARVPTAAFVRPSAQDLLGKLQLESKLDTLGVANSPSPPSVSWGNMLVLDNVHKFSNLGTIMRCAEAFGIKEVACIMQDAAVRSYIRASI